jgi:Putative Flp pilus-assembly TadE/G-like
MKNLRMTLPHRDRERGAVALLVAVMWTALFGMAVVAVDFGYLYTKKRGMQGAVDGALKASMPVFKQNGGGTTGATAALTRAQQVALLSGFQNAEVTALTGLPANQFGIKIQRSHPTFFGGLFGIGSKNLSAQATGELTAPASGPAIHAIDPTSCGTIWSQSGIEVTGNGHLLVKGDMESMGHLHIGNLEADCDTATNCRVTGSVKTGCPSPDIFNDAPGLFGMPTMTYNTPTPDPLAGHDVAWFSTPGKCTNGSSMVTAAVPFVWVPGTLPCVGDALPNNSVWCANGDITVNPPSGTLCPSTAAFISANGVVNINTAGAVTLTGPAATDRIIAFSGKPSGAGDSIFLTNGPGVLYTLTGHVYAPAGQIRAGSQSPGVTIDGMMVGSIILINAGLDAQWTIGSSGSAGPGSGWRIYR